MCVKSLFALSRDDFWHFFFCCFITMLQRHRLRLNNNQSERENSIHRLNRWQILILHFFFLQVIVVLFGRVALYAGWIIYVHTLHLLTRPTFGRNGPSASIAPKGRLCHFPTRHAGPSLADGASFSLISLTSCLRCTFARLTVQRKDRESIKAKQKGKQTRACLPG